VAVGSFEEVGCPKTPTTRLGEPEVSGTPFTETSDGVIHAVGSDDRTFRNPGGLNTGRSHPRCPGPVGRVYRSGITRSLSLS
jgi:hypothetical protein